MDAIVTHLISPEAIRKTAERNELPVDRIT
jgi:hypothetical protein